MVHKRTTVNLSIIFIIEKLTKGVGVNFALTPEDSPLP